MLAQPVYTGSRLPATSLCLSLSFSRLLLPPTPSLCFCTTGTLCRVPRRTQIHPSARPPPPAFIKFLRLRAEESVRIKTGTIIKGAYLLSTRSIEETQKSQGLAMADMSGQAVGTRRWAQSASAAFLAKLLLAWLPLERRLRKEASFTVNHGVREPFQACLFWPRVGHL